jgi:hypothetical protein
MKSQVVSEYARSGAVPPPAAAKEAVTGEIPLTEGEPEPDDEDVFKEIPTVANQANPTFVAGSAPDRAPSLSGQHESAGTYRIVHPTTSDVVNPPAATKLDTGAGKRLVIGPPRKPR